MDESDALSLHMMVGEIRSDVKKLLKSDATYDARIRKVEFRQWWISGVGAAVAAFVVKIGLPEIWH